MKVAVAAFAKTPGVSPVKTRLSERIGRQRAEEFYRLSLLATEQMMLAEKKKSVHDVSPFWAIAESDQIENSCWRNIPAMWTGEGGLGERLASVSSKLHETHDAVFLIGTDCPQLSTGFTSEAMETLLAGSCDCVIGPAVDGGFYLYASLNPVETGIWTAVTYSAETTRSELVKELELKGFKAAYLREERDVDTIDDLAVLKDRLDSETGLLPAQTRLLDWLNETSF